MPVDGVTFDEVQPVLHAMTENVLLEIQKTFDFFKATASSDRIDRIVLSGGASRVDGFAQALEERFGAPVEAFDPFRKIAFDAGEARDRRSARRRADGGGRRRPRAPKGGRPMIRINLLAVERAQAKKKVAPFQTGQKLTVGCSLILVAGRAVHRLAVLERSRSESTQLDADIAAAQQETARLHVDHPAGAAVRAAQGAAAAARRAHRAAAQGADGPGAHARPDQPGAAADAVAHGS